MSEIQNKYNQWLKKAVADEDVVLELQSMEGNDKEIRNAFYRDLEFGTGGLRGIIGAGTNRMNIYTVAKASQGLANYIKKQFSCDKWHTAISYDSRIKSDQFAQIAAGVFAFNGIHVSIYRKLMPTPCLSYAVRKLDCAAGIMVTASHNPSKYNGYKVYGPDGCQITTEAAVDIFREIEKLDIFDDVNWMEFSAGKTSGMISYIPDDVYDSYIDNVKKQSVLFGDETDKTISIMYSPLNGTGLKPVLRTLGESGFENITVVTEQKDPDGNFPTCPYPNPETKGAMELGVEYAKKCNADLLIASDPDCDRVGIAVKNDQGEYVLLSGNETGVLLFDYICSQRIEHGRMPENPVMIKTIVTTDMAEKIAEKYGVETINVLTGFKYIGEQIGILESQGKEDSYIFGFEESYGYLTGSYVRDKDGVDAALMICEMYAYYKTRGVSLCERLNELYQEYGYWLNTLYSFTFEGPEGFDKMQSIMNDLRSGVEKIDNKTITAKEDYIKGQNGLPSSNVIRYLLEGDCSVTVRPSGTEPKIKIYISVKGNNQDKALKAESGLADFMRCYFI